MRHELKYKVKKHREARIGKPSPCRRLRPDACGLRLTTCDVSKMYQSGFTDGENVEADLVKGFVVEDVATIEDKSRFCH